MKEEECDVVINFGGHHFPLLSLHPWEENNTVHGYHFSFFILLLSLLPSCSTFLSLSEPLCLYLSSVYLSLLPFPRLLQLITWLSDFHADALGGPGHTLLRPATCMQTHMRAHTHFSRSSFLPPHTDLIATGTQGHLCWHASHRPEPFNCWL